jgi:alpha-N-arabinofuranosidase
LYAELIQNRAFQGSSFYPRSLVAWTPINGSVLSLQNLSQPLSSALPTSMNVATGIGNGIVGFANSGYWGIDVKAQKYTGSFYVKGSYTGAFTVSLQSNLTNEAFASTQINSNSTPNQWVQHEFTLTPEKDAPNVNNTFAITFESSVSSFLSTLRTLWKLISPGCPRWFTRL